jgi:hypothetical protein
MLIRLETLIQEDQHHAIVSSLLEEQWIGLVNIVALSNIEFEYMALTKASSKAMRLKKLLVDLRFPWVMPVVSVLEITKVPMHFKKTLYMMLEELRLVWNKKLE